MKFHIGELLTDLSGNSCLIISVDNKSASERVCVNFMGDKFFIYDKESGHAFNAVFNSYDSWFSIKELKQYIKQGVIKRYKVL